MRASGSNSVRVEETFVPEHHVGYLSPGLAGTAESMVDGTAGTRLHGNPMYLGRLAGPFHITLVMTVVGAARAALDEYEEVITTRKTQSMVRARRLSAPLRLGSDARGCSRSPDDPVLRDVSRVLSALG
jgi:3-hydroxy-9,10-secoandrosta-1,3,5(10)-triene-9,17-dione monooxygenase